MFARLSFAIATVAVVALVGCSDDVDETTSGAGGGAGEGGTAEPPTPPECASNEAAQFDGTCLQVGVPADGCSVGFESDGDGGCLPIMPSDECPPGQMALLGEANCVDIAPCAGKWGDAPPNSAHYVDAAYSGGGSNGSQAQPWTTITSAISVASPGDAIAIAAGSYDEVVVLSKQLSLWGACPTTATIHGDGSVAVFVEPNAAASEIHHLGIADSTYGLVSLAADTLLEGVWAHDTGLYGVWFDGDSAPGVSGSIQHSLIQRCGGAGVAAFNAPLTMVASQVLDALADVNGVSGRGITTSPGAAAGQLELERVIVQRARTAGIQIRGTAANLDGVLVKDTLGRPADGLNGIGITMRPLDGHRSSGLIRGAVVDGARRAGVHFEDTDVTFDNSVVRNVSVDSDSLTNGQGIYAIGWDEEAFVSVRSSLVEQTVASGIFGGSRGVVGSGAGKVHLEVVRTVIRDIASKADGGRFGMGIYAQGAINLTIQTVLEVDGCRVDRTTEVGVLALETIMDVRGSHVRDVAPNADGEFGDGVLFLRYFAGASPVSGSASGMIIQEAARAGVSNFGAAVSIDTTLLDCNAVHLNGEPSIDGVPFSYEKLGDVFCGCGGVDQSCKVLSSGLVPPLPM